MLSLMTLTLNQSIISRLVLNSAWTFFSTTRKGNSDDWDNGNDGQRQLPPDKEKQDTGSYNHEDRREDRNDCLRNKHLYGIHIRGQVRQQLKMDLSFAGKYSSAAKYGRPAGCVDHVLPAPKHRSVKKWFPR